MELSSRSQLIQRRIDLIKIWKRELKKETDLVQRASNFKWFKQICRDRVHDALAGYCETKSGAFYWYADKFGN